MNPFEPQEFDPSIIDSDLYEHKNRNNPRTQATTERNVNIRRSESDTITDRPQKDSSTANGNGNKEPGFWDKLIAFFCDRRFHGVVGLAVIFFAFYVLISSIAFFATCKADQSAISAHSVEELAENPSVIENIGGPSGAVIAQVILTNSLGIGALVLIIYLIFIGLALLGVRKIGFWSFTFRCLLISVTLSLVAGLLTYATDSYILWGGQHGRVINMLLIERFGWIGAVGVSLFLIGTVAFVYLDELIRFYKAIQRKKRERQERLAAEREAADALRKKVESGVTDEVIQPAPDVETAPEQNNPFESEVVDFSDDIEVAEENHARPVAESVENEDIESQSESPAATTDQTAEVELTVNVPVIEQVDSQDTEAYDPTADLYNYSFPSLELLKEYEVKTSCVDLEQQEELKKRLTKTLADYKIGIQKIEATVGATITLYEIIPVEGTRIQQIKTLGDDLMLSLSAKGIRIIAPIPGKGTIGIEVPNQEPQTVSIRSILGSKEFQETKCELPMAMGTTISNKVYIADLAKMPHLLVAGATGQGKSVGLNTIIASLLYKKHPSTLKFVLVDPKMVEFSLYSRIEKHYLAKLEGEEDAIITSPDKVVNTLNSLCVEMDNRYTLLRDAGCRSIIEYNDKFTSRRLNPEKGHRYLPYIVIIVDEFADLIMTAGKEVETPIARIAQKARAVGMHMIIATQRPSTNVITGVIKANFPGRMAFKTSQGVDSKTILDRPGANQLIGRGDMLILNGGMIDRVQCAFIDTPEVDNICNHISAQVGYEHAYYLPEYVPEGSNAGNADISETDPLFAECARFIVLTSTASTSSLQRRYSIGYNRAGKIIDQMESAGIVGPAKGSKPREVLMDSGSLELLLERMNIR